MSPRATAVADALLATEAAADGVLIQSEVLAATTVQQQGQAQCEPTSSDTANLQA